MDNKVNETNENNKVKSSTKMPQKKSSIKTWRVVNKSKNNIMLGNNKNVTATLPWDKFNELFKFVDERCFYVTLLNPSNTDIIKELGL